MSIQIEREELPETEHVRGKNIYWNNRYWWQKMLDRLRRYERADEDRLLQLIAESTNSEEAMQHVQQLCQTLSERAEWYMTFRHDADQIIQELEDSLVTHVDEKD
ncbi:MAG: hypothetical protein AAGF95_21570 [Chloroflexota bacterium]